MKATPARKNFRDLSVTLKISTAVALGVLVAVVTGLVGLNALSAASDRTAAMHPSNVVGSQLAQEVRYQFLSSRFNSTSSTYSTTPEAKADYLEQRDEARAALADAAKRLRAE